MTKTLDYFIENIPDIKGDEELADIHLQSHMKKRLHLYQQLLKVKTEGSSMPMQHLQLLTEEPSSDKLRAFSQEGGGYG